MSIVKFNNKQLQFNNKMVGWPTPEPPPSFDGVQIGTQIWLDKNLFINDGEEGIIEVDNVSANNVNFGKQYYYTWDAAKRVANNIDGWHLPSSAEFQTLSGFIGNNGCNKLKSTNGWNDNKNGTDDYSFNGLPVGYFYDNTHYEVGEDLIIWSTDISFSSEYTTQIKCLLLNAHTDNINLNVAMSDVAYLPVRLIKDT